MKNNYTRALFAAAILMFFGTLQSFATEYTISFTGSGKSTTVGSVEVKNLTQGTMVTVPAGSNLILSDVNTGINQLSTSKDGLRISSNSMEGKCAVSFVAKQAGSTQISAYSLDGRKIAGMTKTLQKGENSFQLALPAGTYVINVRGQGFTYSSKMVSLTSNQAKPDIAFVGNVKQNASKDLKSANADVIMYYLPEEILLYKGISGNYATIVTDVPTASKTTNFNFVECKDASGNYYATVKIGDQTWMAENLRTTKYRNNATIPNLTLAADWGNAALVTGAWCYLNNADSNDVKFGKIYNWFAASDPGNIAPIGWHVPTVAEYETLGNLAGGVDGLPVAAIKLKSTEETRYWVTNWATNETGFSARGGGKCNSAGTMNDFNYCYLWTASEINATNGTCVFMVGATDDLNITYSPGKRNGFSLRCVLD